MPHLLQSSLLCLNTLFSCNFIIWERHIVSTMTPLHPTLTLVDGIGHYSTKIFVPEDLDLQCELLKVYHDAISAGHPGAASTLASLERDYWWP